MAIAGKNVERRQACHSSQWSACIFLWISWAIIGYGYSLWCAAAWSAAFIIIGALVFRRTEEAYRNRMPFGLAYSFDTFIPLIKLRERHYKIEISGRARYYFYIHKLAGWLLGSFLVAAIAGLTK